MKKVVLICFCVIILTILSISCTDVNNSEQGNLKVEIIDITNGKGIEEGKFIITDIGKEFVITTDNNIINIPYKKVTEKNKYPYGYTTITTAEGHYPRIDHNFKIGGKTDAKITLELTPKESFINQSFTEVFHYSSEVELVEFMNYYSIN